MAYIHKDTSRRNLDFIIDAIVKNDTDLLNKFEIILKNKHLTKSRKTHLMELNIYGVDCEHLAELRYSDKEVHQIRNDHSPSHVPPHDKPIYIAKS